MSQSQYKRMYLLECLGLVVLLECLGLVDLLACLELVDLLACLGLVSFCNSMVPYHSCLGWCVAKWNRQHSIYCRYKSTCHKASMKEWYLLACLGLVDLLACLGLVVLLECLGLVDLLACLGLVDLLACLGLVDLY